MAHKNKMVVNFNYKDGLRDGELGVLDGYKFNPKDIVIYLLINMGYKPEWIANAFLGLTEESIQVTYSKLKHYRNEIYAIKQQRAMRRLINTIQNK